MKLYEVTWQETRTFKITAQVMADSPDEAIKAAKDEETDADLEQLSVDSETRGVAKVLEEN